MPGAGITAKVARGPTSEFSKSCNSLRVCPMSSGPYPEKLGEFRGGARGAKKGGRGGASKGTANNGFFAISVPFPSISTPYLSQIEIKCCGIQGRGQVGEKWGGGGASEGTVNHGFFAISVLFTSF